MKTETKSGLPSGTRHAPTSDGGPPRNWSGFGGDGDGPSRDWSGFGGDGDGPSCDWSGFDDSGGPSRDRSGGGDDGGGPSRDWSGVGGDGCGPSHDSSGGGGDGGGPCHDSEPMDKVEAINPRKDMSSLVEMFPNYTSSQLECLYMLSGNCFSRTVDCAIEGISLQVLRQLSASQMVVPLSESP